MVVIVAVLLVGLVMKVVMMLMVMLDLRVKPSIPQGCGGEGHFPD